MVQHFDIPISANFGGQKGFDVLAVDLNILPAPSHIFPVFILQDHKTHPFEVCCGHVEALSHGEHKIVPNDFLRVPAYKFEIVTGCLPLGYISVKRVHTCRQTAGTFDICLLCDQNTNVPGLPRRRNGSIASRRASSDNKDVCCYILSFHRLK